MKTETTTTAAPTESRPGNLSTRQLAATLLKTSAPSQSATEKTSAPATAANREEPPAEEAAPAQPSPETETSTENPQPATEGATETAPESTETPDGQEAAEEGAETNAPETTGAKPELPTELADAMELAKADGKKGTAQLLKRVHKLVDERDTQRNARLAAEETAKQLRTELQEARKATPNANGATSTQHPAVAEVSNELANIDHWIGWCDNNPDGGEVPDNKGGAMTLTAAQVKKIQRDLDQQRTELVARKINVEQTVRTAYERQYAESHKAAVQAFPWVAKQDSTEYHDMQAILRVFPAFKQSPDYELAIGDYLAGRRLREGREQVRGTVAHKPAPAREPTRVPTAPPGGGASQVSAGEKEEQASAGRFRASGRTSDLAKQFSASRRASRS